MKITITTTEIEANEKDLRASNTLSENISNFLRRILQITEPYDDDGCEEERNEDEQHTD